MKTSVKHVMVRLCMATSEAGSLVFSRMMNCDVYEEILCSDSTKCCLNFRF